MGLDSLVAVTLLLLVERHLNGFFLQQPALDVITLLLVKLIVSRAWSLQVRLLRIGCSKVILPEIAPLGRAHKRIYVLAAVDRVAVPRVVHRDIHCACVTSRRTRVDVGVVARTGLVIFDHLAFAVGNFGQEDALVALRVKLTLVIGRHKFVGARTGVILGWELFVFNINCRFEDFAVRLGCLEVSDWCSLLRMIQDGVVESWANRVVSTATVHVDVRFL